MSDTPQDWYVLVCRECDGDDPKSWLVHPFTSPEARGRWAAEHKAGTGHDRWWVHDQLAQTPAMTPPHRNGHQDWLNVMRDEGGAG